MEQDSDVHLSWNNHQTTVLSVLSSLLSNENLVDCTISAEGQYFKAHRVILSACSPYFESLFSEHCETHPVVILPDVKFEILKALMEFMYSGEVKVQQNKLFTVLDLADSLQIKGLSSAGDSDVEDNLRTMRRNESPTLCDQQGFRKYVHELRYVSQVKQKENVTSSHTSEKKCSEHTDSLLLTAQKCDKNSSKCISAEKTVEEPVVSKAFNVLQCSSITKTPAETNTHVSGTLLNSDFNILVSSQLPVSSKETIGEQKMLTGNVLLTHSTSDELRTLEPLGMNDERPTADHLPEVKQEDSDNLEVNSIEEIILDEDTGENYDHYNGICEDNKSNVIGRVLPEGSDSVQGFCTLEQYRDTYFVEPVSVLPNPFKCETCGRSYRYSRGLWKHKKFKCGREPQFSCPQCPAKYYHKHNLKAHFQRTHLPF